MRTKNVHDLTNTRFNTKTSRYCCICNRDISPDSTARIVHLLNNEYIVIHPDDWEESMAVEREFLVGPHCARRVGLEWSKAEMSR